jgi:hypothetical protein
LEKAKLFVLLAAERSGTHLFRSILTTNRAAFAPGEVANAGASVPPKSETNFFLFRKQAMLANEALFIPSVPSNQAIVAGFFDKFAATAAARGSKAAVCDIKYAHMVNFAGGWWDMMSRPFLIEWARRRDVHFLHLIRRRVTETCLSNLYAHHTGVWRTKSAAELKVSPMRVDRARLQQDVRRISRVIGLVRDWLAPCRHQEIYYEDLLDGASPSWVRMRALLGHPIPAIRSDFLKTTPPLAEVIENYDDIADQLHTEIALPKKA